MYVGKERGYMFNNTKKGSEKNRACKRFKTAKPFRLIWYLSISRIRVMILRKSRWQM